MLESINKIDWSCKICNKKSFNCLSLTSHVRQSHNIKLKDYYDKYMKQNENEGICKVCGLPTTFTRLSKGYHTYCCNRSCSNSDIDVINKKKLTSIKHFGVDVPMKSDVIKKKSKDTLLERYGNANYSNINKGRETKLKLYGDENYTNKEKTRKTCLEKYGVDCSFKSPEIREKIHITVKEKYGVDTVTQNKEISNKIKISKSKRTSEQHKESEEKRKVTLFNIYGNRNYVNYEKSKLTRLIKYGDENYTNRKKMVNTKLERGLIRNPEELTLIELYRRDVLTETRKWVKQLFKNWDGKCYYTSAYIKNSKIKKYCPSIDHKISIIYGFEHNIDAKIIGNINNLCICTISYNSFKNKRTTDQQILFHANKILEI